MNVATSMDDTNLWNNFREGNELAYTALMRKYSKPLFNYGYRFTKDRNFIKDCIQEVFLVLWSRRSSIKSTNSVKGYLFKALRLRIFKDHAKWKATEEPDENYDLLVEFNIESKMIHEQGLIELSAKIEKIMNDFPSRQKEIVYLRFYENLSHDKIAEIMGLNKQSVYNLLQKALLRFKKEWVFALFLLNFRF